MPRPRLEVAGIIRTHGADFERAFGKVSPTRQGVLRDLAACRTVALGGHQERCPDCGFEQNAYDSCRNRDCPKCQASASAKWLEARQADLLLVEYFHVVFTLPEELGVIALQNKQKLHALLFSASAATLKQIAADPKHLGAELGFVSVLHTWGQNLHHHPHVHCVVSGGGLSEDGDEWVSCPRSFFLPVRVLAPVFRGKFLSGLLQAYAAGRLTFQGSLAAMTDPATFHALVQRVRAKPWVVYAKPPFGGPEHVLKYLARYTHRVAISNRRLVSLEDGRVRFRAKDHASGGRHQILELDAVEFLRRFLLHTLPQRFPRIRHFGFLANRCRARKLEHCRTLLGAAPPEKMAATDRGVQAERLCPKCGQGRLVRVGRVRPASGRTPKPATLDSS